MSQACSGPDGFILTTRSGKRGGGEWSVKAGPSVALFHLLLCSVAPQCDLGLLPITNSLLHFPRLCRRKRGLSSPRFRPAGETTRSRTSPQATECRWDGENAYGWTARELKPPSVAPQTRHENTGEER